MTNSVFLEDEDDLLAGPLPEGPKAERGKKKGKKKEYEELGAGASLAAFCGIGSLTPGQQVAFVRDRLGNPEKDRFLGGFPEWKEGGVVVTFDGEQFTFTDPDAYYEAMIEAYKAANNKWKKASTALSSAQGVLSVVTALLVLSSVITGGTSAAITLGPTILGFGLSYYFNKWANEAQQKGAARSASYLGTMQGEGVEKGIRTDLIPCMILLGGQEEKWLLTKGEIQVLSQELYIAKLPKGDKKLKEMMEKHEKLLQQPGNPGKVKKLEAEIRKYMEENGPFYEGPGTMQEAAKKDLKEANKSVRTIFSRFCSKQEPAQQSGVANPRVQIDVPVQRVGAAIQVN